MGKVISLYSKNEYLYWYIEKQNKQKVKQQIQKYPQIINQPMTADCKSLPLARAVWRGDIKMVQLLLKLNATVNQANINGQTAVLVAAKRNRLQILKLLVAHEADVDAVSSLGLQAIDYAILAGYYEIAYYLYPMIKDKKFKTVNQYRHLASQYMYRYVNYELFLQSLQAKVKPQNLQDIYKKEQKILRDPVIDPRQTWGKWFKRVIDFQSAPLVERDQLPQQLQPQNRSLGKFHHYIDRFVSRSSIKPQIYPKRARSQIDHQHESQDEIQKKKVSHQVQSQL